MYLLIIEWDGRAPARWGHWLKSLNAVHQDGILLVRSESLARAIATILDRGIEVFAKRKRSVVRPRSFELHAMDRVDFFPTDEDKIAADKVERQLSRQGRPLHPRNWIVKCEEEEVTYHEFASEVTMCPVCGSVKITVKAEADHG